MFPFLIVAFMAGFEELMFRGYFYKLFKNTTLAFFLSVFIFAFSHTGFSLYIIYYLPASFIITYAFHRRKAVLDSMLVHATYNILATILNLVILPNL
jgi:membrane protease YdiL (CAAX protease family)